MNKSVCAWMTVAVLGVVACVTGCDRALMRARPVVFQGVYNGPTASATKTGGTWTIVVLAPSDTWVIMLDQVDARPIISDAYITMVAPKTGSTGINAAVDRRIATTLGTLNPIRVNVRVVQEGEPVTNRDPPYHLVDTVTR